MDDINNDLSQLSITPFFDNSFKYSIKDFSLDYTVESSNVVFEPTDFYTKMDYSDRKSRFRYKFETLKPYTDTEPPFRSLKIKSRQSRCRIEIKATYDGASFPYVYVQDVWFLVVDKKNMSDENWRISCKNAIYGLTTAKEYEIFYRTAAGYDYVYDINLANVEDGERESSTVLKEQKTISKEQKETVNSGQQQPVTSDSNAGGSVKKVNQPANSKNVVLKSFSVIESAGGERRTLRLEYEPFEGGWVMFAWEYEDASSLFCYRASWEYLPANSTSHAIELYDPVKKVTQVAQAAPASGIDDLEVNIQNDRIIVKNPNKELLALRCVKGKYTYYHVIQGGASARFRNDDDGKFEYQTFCIPFEPTKRVTFGMTLLLIFCVLMVAMGLYSLVHEIQRGSGMLDKLESLAVIVLFLAILIWQLVAM